MKALLAFFLLLLAPLLAHGAVSGKNLLTGSTTEVNGKSGTVVAFLSAKCPCSNSHLQVFKALAKDYPDFSFVAVHANSDEPAEMAKAYFQAAALPFPVLQDDQLRLANEFHAYKTPHVFLLNAAGKVVYKGGATNSAEAGQATKFYLRDALADLQAGRAVAVGEGRTLGCVIAR